MSSRAILSQLFWAILLVLLQATVFNHICLFGIAVPIVFIFVMLRFPYGLSANWTLTWSFLLGLAVDIFSDTYGMNALACTVTGALRSRIMGLYVPRGEEAADMIPSSLTLGRAAFVKYMLTMSLIYCCIVFFIEAFTLFRPLHTLSLIIGSTILSSAVMLAFDTLATSRRRQQREKRL